jgi:hypothetical protein
LFKKGENAEDDELVGTVAWYVDATVESKVSFQRLAANSFSSHLTILGEEVVRTNPILVCILV